MRNVIKNVVK